MRLRDDGIDLVSMITTYNTAVTDTANLGRYVVEKKLWVTRDVPDLCDERRDLKKRRHEENERKNIANKRVRKALQKAKEDWIDNQCKEIYACPNKTSSKKAFVLVKELTSEKQRRSTTT